MKADGQRPLTECKLPFFVFQRMAAVGRSATVDCAAGPGVPEEVVTDPLLPLGASLLTDRKGRIPDSRCRPSGWLKCPQLRTVGLAAPTPWYRPRPGMKRPEVSGSSPAWSVRSVPQSCRGKAKSPLIFWPPRSIMSQGRRVVCAAPMCLAARSPKGKTCTEKLGPNRLRQLRPMRDRRCIAGGPGAPVLPLAWRLLRPVPRVARGRPRAPARGARR